MNAIRCLSPALPVTECVAHEGSHISRDQCLQAWANAAQELCPRARRAVKCLTAVLATLLAPSAMAGMAFSETFDDLSVSPGLQLVASPGFGFDTAFDQGRFSKASGSGPGFVVLQTTFAMAGDFSVNLSVDRSQTAGAPSVGLSVQTLDGSSYANVWIQPPQRVGYDVAGPGFSSFRAHSSHAPVLSFSISRSADSVLLSGNGRQSFYLGVTNAQLAAPMIASAFFYWTDPGYDGQSLAYIDNFSLTAGSLIPAVPEPSGAVLLLGGGLLLSWCVRCRTKAEAD